MIEAAEKMLLEAKNVEQQIQTKQKKETEEKAAEEERKKAERKAYQKKTMEDNRQIFMKEKGVKGNATIAENKQFQEQWKLKNIDIVFFFN